MNEHFNSLLEFLYKAVRIFGAILLAILIGLTGYDVFMRYTFNLPILGTNEMTQFLLGGLVFCGFVLVTAHRSHIVVTLFEEPLLRHVPRLYKSLVAGFNLLGIIAITVVAFLYTKFQFQMESATEILELAWADLGVVFVVLSTIGILFGFKALKRPRRHGSFVPFKQSTLVEKKACSVELVANKKYKWCACGLSKNQPFCDGSHRGTDMKPVSFIAPITGHSNLCNCKQSANAPYCNGTHKDL